MRLIWHMWIWSPRNILASHLFPRFSILGTRPIPIHDWTDMGLVQSSILTHNMPGHVMVWYRERGRRRWRGRRRIGVGSGEEEVAREEAMEKKMMRWQWQWRGEEAVEKKSRWWWRRRKRRLPRVGEADAGLKAGQ